MANAALLARTRRGYYAQPGALGDSEGCDSSAGVPIIQLARVLLPPRFGGHQVVCAIVDDQLAEVFSAVLDGGDPDV